MNLLGGILLFFSLVWISTVTSSARLPQRYSILVTKSDLKDKSNETRMLAYMNGWEKPQSIRYRGVSVMTHFWDIGQIRTNAVSVGASLGISGRAIVIWGRIPPNFPEDSTTGILRMTFQWTSPLQYNVVLSVNSLPNFKTFNGADWERIPTPEFPEGYLDYRPQITGSGGVVDTFTTTLDVLAFRRFSSKLLYRVQAVPSSPLIVTFKSSITSAPVGVESSPALKVIMSEGEGKSYDEMASIDLMRIWFNLHLDSKLEKTILPSYPLSPDPNLNAIEQDPRMYYDTVDVNRDQLVTRGFIYVKLFGDGYKLLIKGNTLIDPTPRVISQLGVQHSNWFPQFRDPTNYREFISVMLYAHQQRESRPSEPIMVDAMVILVPESFTDPVDNTIQWISLQDLLSNPPSLDEASTALLANMYCQYALRVWFLPVFTNVVLISTRDGKGPCVAINRNLNSSNCNNVENEGDNNWLPRVALRSSMTYSECLHILSESLGVDDFFTTIPPIYKFHRQYLLLKDRIEEFYFLSGNHIYEDSPELNEHWTWVHLDSFTKAALPSNVSPQVSTWNEVFPMPSIYKDFFASEQVRTTLLRCRLGMSPLQIKIMFDGIP